jgi:hypothetical protein
MHIMDNRKKRKTPIFRLQIIFVALGRVKQILEKISCLLPVSGPATHGAIFAAHISNFSLDSVPFPCYNNGGTAG